MASRLPPLTVFITVMVILLTQLLHSSVAAAAVPHIKMLRHSSNGMYISSNNGNCYYDIEVITAHGFSQSNLTFDVYDKYGNSIHVSGVVSFGRAIDRVEGNGQCVERPCNLVVTADKGALASATLNFVEVIVYGRGHNDDVTFQNEAKQVLGPSDKLQINNCASME